MIDLILQVLLGGIATAAICRIIAYYEGPFKMLPRFKNWLIPKAKDAKAISHSLLDDIDATDITALMASFNDIIIKSQEIDGKLAIWHEYQTKMNPKFYNGLRGTLYNLLDCPFCIGPYVSAIIGLILTIHNIGYIPASIETVHITNWVLVSAGTLGLHFIISKQWAKEDGDNG